MLATTPTREHTIFTLAAQLMAVAASDADRARIDKALDLVEGVERMADRPDLFLVTSQTVADAAYRVHQDQCNCPDASRRDARRCKHAVAVALFQQLERLDAEQTDPTPDADTYYCVLCEEPIPAAEVVETRWGFMHERCAASEPRETDEDARYELTGRAYWTLLRPTALPAPVGTITVQPTPAHLVALADELFGGDAA